ncbi:DNA-binding NarL/FixJ family response regulator [Bradyrhizobium liaoningense]
MVAIVLRVNHFEVAEAESGAAGLKAFAESPFDAAIVDIFLGDTSGADVIATLRERAPTLPIVAVSRDDGARLRGPIAPPRQRGLPAKAVSAERSAAGLAEGPGRGRRQAGRSRLILPQEETPRG